MQALSSKPGNFIKGIVADLQSSDLVIADLTGSRPNVYYELGTRHALKVGTVIITQDFDAVPSDLSGYYAFPYDYTSQSYEQQRYFKTFEQKLHDVIKEWYESDDTCDSPVSDFLGILNQVLQKELEHDRRELTTIMHRLKKAILHNIEVCEFLASAFTETEPSEAKDELMIIDLFQLEVIYNKLLGFGWRCIPADAVDHLADIVIHFHRLCGELKQCYWVLRTSPNPHPTTATTFTALVNDLCKRREEFENVWKALMDGIEDIKVVKNIAK